MFSDFEKALELIAEKKVCLPKLLLFFLFCAQHHAAVVPRADSRYKLILSCRSNPSI